MQQVVNSAAYVPMLFTLLSIEAIALFLSTMHLGKPHRFYRAFNNLKYSPVSREVASIAVFFNLFAVYTMLTVFSGLFDFLPQSFYQTLVSAMGWGAAIAGPVALYFMHSIYRIKARPFWNHWQVLSSFYGSMLSLGALVVLIGFGSVAMYEKQTMLPLINYIALPLMAGLLIEAIGLVRHRADMNKQGGEGAASFYEQTTTFGKTYLLRNALLVLSIVAVAVLSLSQADGAMMYMLWMLALLMILTAAFIGRAMFYVLVIPTTMPGAFFWRNKGFQEHARETGLAEMEQVGVLPDMH